MIEEIELGHRLRSLRHARRLTLRVLAARSGLTESFLSQVERGVTSPSIASVQRIAQGLDVSLAQIFADEPSPGRVVRRNARRRVAVPTLGAVDEYLTSNPAGRLQVLFETIEPGAGATEESFTHDSDEEVIVVLTGTVDLWVADEHYLLGDGDAITIQPRLPHWIFNGGDGPATLFIAMTPPSL